MGFKTLRAASLMSFGNSFHSLGADARKVLPPYIAVLFLGILKSERAQIGGFSLVYIFRSGGLDILVLSHSVL